MRILYHGALLNANIFLEKYKYLARARQPQVLVLALLTHTADENR